MYFDKHGLPIGRTNQCQNNNIYFIGIRKSFFTDDIRFQKKLFNLLEAVFVTILFQRNVSYLLLRPSVKQSSGDSAY